MDGLLGLVTMLPQEHVADPFPELWSQKPILYLLRNDIIWKRNKQVRPRCTEKARAWGLDSSLGTEYEQRDPGREGSSVALPLTVGTATPNLFMYKVVYISLAVCTCGQKFMLFLSLL